MVTDPAGRAAGRFAGKVAIVTGGSGGIGLAVARRLAAEGAGVALVDLRVDAARAALEQLRGLGAPDALALACDVSVETQVAAACEQTVTHFGRMDVIVNVAGMMIYTPLDALTGADWSRLLGVNFLGAAYFTSQAFRHMREGGAIVNVASVHALETTPLVAPYAAAKAALLSLTRSTAIEGKARGIRANAVLPGAIDTPMLWASPNLKSGAETLSPGDVGQPDEVAAAVAFLAADEASFVTGAALAVDGGRLGRL
jgi:NAD(P)-dependent dehydrogenase (short-subunit alcohol dehydrogenase family)